MGKKSEFKAHMWATGVCDSGKRSYGSRRAAKEYNTQMRGRGGDRLNAYLCEKCETWHLGHLPPIVRSGEKGRGEVYGGGA